MIVTLLIHALQALAPPFVGWGAAVAYGQWLQHRQVLQNVQRMQHMRIDPHPPKDWIQVNEERAKSSEHLTRQEVTMSALVGVLIGGLVALALSFL